MKIKINAGENQTFALTGSDFAIIEAVERVKVFLTLNDGERRYNEMVAGQGWTVETGKRFTTVEIYSAVTQDIEFVYSLGVIRDGRISGQINVKEISGALTGLPVLNFDTQAKTIAANASRRELHLKSADTNIGAIWLSATAINSGIPIEAGEVVVLQQGQALDVFAETIGDKLYLMELI